MAEQLKNLYSEVYIEKLAIKIKKSYQIDSFQKYRINY